MRRIRRYIREFENDKNKGGKTLTHTAVISSSLAISRRAM